VFRAGASAPGLSVTVSAGVASLLPGATAQDLVLLADQALYLAKDGGRNRVVVAGPASAALAEADLELPAPPLHVVRAAVGQALG
jgi:hypothetical protein